MCTANNLRPNTEQQNSHNNPFLHNMHRTKLITRIQPFYSPYLRVGLPRRPFTHASVLSPNEMPSLCSRQRSTDIFPDVLLTHYLSAPSLPMEQAHCILNLTRTLSRIPSHMWGWNVGEMTNMLTSRQSLFHAPAFDLQTSMMLKNAQWMRNSFNRKCNVVTKGPRPYFIIQTFVFDSDTG